MGSAVHQPGGIEHNGIPQESGNIQAVFESFTPEIPGHKCGQDEAHQQDSGFVMPTLRNHTPSQQTGHRPTDFHHHWVGLSLSFHIVRTVWQETEQEGWGGKSCENVVSLSHFLDEVMRG